MSILQDGIMDSYFIELIIILVLLLIYVIFVSPIEEPARIGKDNKWFAVMPDVTDIENINPSGEPENISTGLPTIMFINGEGSRKAILRYDGTVDGFVVHSVGIGDTAETTGETKNEIY